MRRNGRKIARARWRMQQALGRPLQRHEHVHHKNGDCADDRLENLQVMPHSIHIFGHNACWPFLTYCFWCGKPFWRTHHRSQDVPRFCGKHCAVPYERIIRGALRAAARTGRVRTAYARTKRPYEIPPFFRAHGIPLWQAALRRAVHAYRRSAPSRTG